MENEWDCPLIWLICSRNIVHFLFCHNDFFFFNSDDFNTLPLTERKTAFLSNWFKCYIISPIFFLCWLLILSDRVLPIIFSIIWNSVYYISVNGYACIRKYKTFLFIIYNFYIICISFLFSLLQLLCNCFL